MPSDVFVPPRYSGRPLPAMDHPDDSIRKLDHPDDPRYFVELGKFVSPQGVVTFEMSATLTKETVGNLGLYEGVK